MAFLGHIRNVLTGRAYRWNTLQEHVVAEIDERIETLAAEDLKDAFALFYTVAGEFIAALYGAGDWAGADQALPDLDVKSLDEARLAKLEGLVAAHAAAQIGSDAARSALAHVTNGDADALAMYDSLRSIVQKNGDSAIHVVSEIMSRTGTQEPPMMAGPLSLALLRIHNAALGASERAGADDLE